MVTIPKVTLNTDLNEGFCFGCGVNNPIGLKLKFTRKGDTISAIYKPEKMHQGWPGLLHGGIVACLLDEAMSNMSYSTGNTCVTASITIRQRQPIPLGKPLTVTARITRHRKKLIETSGEITLPDGTVVAEGSAKQFIATSQAGPDMVREKRRHV